MKTRNLLFVYLEDFSCRVWPNPVFSLGGITGYGIPVYNDAFIYRYNEYDTVYTTYF